MSLVRLANLTSSRLTSPSRALSQIDNGPVSSSGGFADSMKMMDANGDGELEYKEMLDYFKAIGMRAQATHARTHARTHTRYTHHMHIHTHTHTLTHHTHTTHLDPPTTMLGGGTPAVSQLSPRPCVCIARN